MGKITIAAGFAAGYVLGARAGRQRYETLMSTARTFVSNPKVQQTTGSLQHSAGDVFSKAKATVTDKVASRRGAGSTNDADLYSTSSYDVVEIPETRVSTTSGSDNSGI
jgi:hypothetical protein